MVLGEVEAGRTRGKRALTAYLVSLAIFIPISSWVADRFGAKLVFRVAVGVFVIGSTAISAASRQISVAIGVAVGGGILEGMTYPTGEPIVAASFSVAFLIVGAVTALALMPFLRLPKAPEARCPATA